MEIQEVKDSAKEFLDKIPAEEKREMIAKSRFTCESNWMMALVFAAGWEAANKMNLQVGQAVGKAEMHRLMKLSGIEKPRSNEDIMRLVTMAMETFITKDYFDYEFKVLGPGKTRALSTDVTLTPRSAVSAWRKTTSAAVPACVPAGMRPWD